MNQAATVLIFMKFNGKQLLASRVLIFSLLHCQSLICYTVIEHVFCFLFITFILAPDFIEQKFLFLTLTIMSHIMPYHLPYHPIYLE